MIIEQQQVDRKFGEFVLVLKEKFSFTPRRKREVTREDVFFSPGSKALFY
jgi:hypothetical protein